MCKSGHLGSPIGRTKRELSWLCCLFLPVPSPSPQMIMPHEWWPCRPDNNPRGVPISRCDNACSKKLLCQGKTRGLQGSSPHPRYPDGLYIEEYIGYLFSSSSPSNMLCSPIHVPCFHVFVRIILSELVLQEKV